MKETNKANLSYEDSERGYREDINISIRSKKLHPRLNEAIVGTNVTCVSVINVHANPYPISATAWWSLLLFVVRKSTKTISLL